MAGELGEEDSTSDHALQELMADNSDQMQPTKKRIRTSLTIFRTYLLDKNLEPCIEETYSPEQLNTVLTNFFLEMKKPDGKNYAGTSLKSIRYGLQKHFLKLRNEDIVRDEKYSGCNETFKALVKIMTEETEVQKQRNSIHPDDVAKLYNTAFSTDSPKGLQRKTIFEFIYYFCDRGREHLRRVRKEDFVFSEDSAGREYVTVKGRYSKRESHAKSESVRMYSRPGDPTCPVRSFKKYLRKLNPMNPCFWQRPKRTYYQSDVVWYENAPLGKNMLSALMFNLSEEAKLSKKYNNSSIRATDLTELEYQSDLTRLDHQSNLTRLNHQSNLTMLDDQSETTYVISKVISDLGHQNSCADCDNQTSTPIVNEYRNILIGEAANAWKQLIGRFYWLHDSEIAQHLIEVHEVYCMSKGICPLERTRDVQNSDPVCGTVGQIPTKRSGEREEMSLKLEVDEVDDDSVDEDLSGDSDLDFQSEEENEGKEEPYSIEAESRVPYTNNESLDSGGHNSHTTTEVKQEPSDSNSEAGSFTVINNTMGTGEVIWNQTFQTKPASVSEVQTSLLTTLKHTVITKQTQNSSTTESHQGQRSPQFRFSSAQGVKNEDPPTGLLNLYTEQKGSTLYIKKGNTPNSILVCSKNSGSFQPATLNLLTKSETQSSSALERYRVLPNVGPPAPVSCQPISASSKLGRPPRVSCRPVLTSPKVGHPVPVSCRPVLTSPKVGQPVPVSCLPVLSSPKVGHPVSVSCQPALNSSPNTAFSVIKDGQEPSPASTVIFIKKGQQGTPEPSVPSLKGYDTVQALSSLLREKPSPRTGVSLLQGQNTPVSQGQNTPVSQGQNTPVSGASQGQHTPVSVALQGHNTPVSGASQGQHISVSGVLQHTPVSGVLQGQHTSVSGASQGQHTPVSGALQGQHTAVSGSLQGQHTAVSGLLQGQHTPVSGALQGQHTSVSGSLQGQHTPVSEALQGQHTPVSRALQGQHTPVSGSLQGQHTPVSGALQGQHTSVSGASQGQHTPVSGLLQGHNTPVSGALQGHNTPVSDSSQGQHTSVSGALQHTSVSGVLQGQHTPALHGQITSMSCVSVLQGQTSPVKGFPAPSIPLSKGTQNGPHVPHFLLIKGGQHSPSPGVSMMTSGQHTSQVPGFLLIRGGKQTSHGSDLHGELQGEQKEKETNEMVAEDIGELEMGREENLSRETESSGEESSKDWKSRRKRKSPTRIPSELATEDQAGRGTSLGDSPGSDSEDKPIVKKSKRDEDS